MRIFILVLFLVLSGCSTSPKVASNPPEYSGEGNQSIYIVSHGWHTGIVFPTGLIKTSLPELYERFNKNPYIELGWGDKGFYQAKEITTSLTLQAIFWPTDSVLHAVAAPKDVHTFFSNSVVEKLCVNEAELESLGSFITGSFERTDSGAVIPLKQGIYGDSQFYQGVGSYYLMNTCNKWTAKGLESIGMDISTSFKLTAGSIMDFVRSEKEQSLDGWGQCGRL